MGNKSCARQLARVQGVRLSSQLAAIVKESGILVNEPPAHCGRVTAIPDGTRKWGYGRVGDNPTGTLKCNLVQVAERVAPFGKSREKI